MKNYFFIGLICVCVSCFSCATKVDVSKESLSKSDEVSKSQNEKKQDVIFTELVSDVSARVASENPEPLVFNEVWGYLLDGRENELLPSFSDITDIGYFGAGLNTFGKLVGVPKPEKIKNTILSKNTNLTKSNIKSRIHLVIVDNSRALTHFCLDPEYSVRKKLISDIVDASKNFDGVQIDFELVSSQDEEHYLSFLEELKRKMPKKILSVAIPARLKTLEKDAYHYHKINEIVDKIIVMAYDEHWATSKPGPVASIDWCNRVANYALSIIPESKLVMGLPFYGRGWSTDDTAGAYRYPSIERLQNNNQITQITRINDIPTFEIKKEVTYKFYYDDIHSLVSRMKMYQQLGVKNIGFWRLGQEGTDVWNYIKIR